MKKERERNVEKYYEEKRIEKKKKRADEKAETQMVKEGQSRTKEGIHGVFSTARHDCLSCLVCVTTALILFLR